MRRIVLLMMGCLALADCGLGETAVSGVSGGISEAKQAQEAQKTEAAITQKLDEAAATNARRRKAAEADAE